MARPKEQIGAIIRKTGELFKVSDVALVLNISKKEASKRLARWKKQGWLTRIQRGIYATVPIDAMTTDRAFEDSWILVPELFSPAYIGGWSAAEHWDFTEQIFRDICVITENSVPHKIRTVHNTKFFLTHIQNATTFGTKNVWRHERKILLSDPHRTIIDMLYDPRLGGGIQHVANCFEEYIKSSYFNAEVLGGYAEKFDNGAVFKRLGFLCEKKLGKTHLLTQLCRLHLTKGNIYFDPQLKDGNLITRWKLFVPTTFTETQ